MMFMFTLEERKEALAEGYEIKHLFTDMHEYAGRHQIPKHQTIKIHLIADNLKKFTWLKPYLLALGKMDCSFSTTDAGIKYNQIFFYKDFKILIEDDTPLEQLKANYENRISILKKEIERSEKMLLTPAFLQKAPKEKIENEKNKLEKNTSELEAISIEYDRIK